MSAAVQDELDVIVADHRPSRVEARRLIVAAVNRTAAAHNGRVHIAWLRDQLPAWIDQHQIGAVICALVRMHLLDPTGEYLPNGLHRSRNRTKPAEVRLLREHLPHDLFDA